MPRLPEMAEALLKPAAYPDVVPGIELVQTQMSFVFIAGDYVFKVKKPVNLGYLDYTTLEKRRFYCQREVELNRRLCPDTYLGVLPVTRESDNSIVIDGRGTVIEYAVKMRRLPQAAMMNVLLIRNQVSPAMVTSVAQKLAQFHRQAETSAAICAFGNLDTVNQNTTENFSQTEKYVGKTISRAKYRNIRDYTEGFIKKNSALFNKRGTGGRIRDCHGDLHAAHICFTDGICIYDCIEFNDRFRYTDVASEVAFLAMDLDHYGRADLSRTFIKAYVAQSEDSELLRLLNFYKCYRAYVRGKVESFQLDDPYIAEDKKQNIRESASSYFDLAHAYARSRPLLIITTGVVGTGKTTVAQALARRLGLVVISSDVIRKQLAGVPLSQHRFEEMNTGIYSPEFSRKTYDALFSEAKQVLTEGGSVVLDAAFIRSGERQSAKKLAAEAGADFFIVECTLDEAVIKERLAQRLERGSVSDGRWEILAPQQQQFEPVTEVPPTNHITIDTAVPPDTLAREVEARISGNGASR